MSIQMQVLEALRALVDGLGICGPVAIGPLPVENGLAMEVSTGRVSAATLNGGGTVTLDVVLNIRHARQASALDTLCRIHEALVHIADLPSGDGWQMTAIRTGGAPGYLDREGLQWMYGSSLTVEYAVG